jgi:hypothetical protein
MIRKGWSICGIDLNRVGQGNALKILTFSIPQWYRVERRTRVDNPSKLRDHIMTWLRSFTRVFLNIKGL